MSECGNLSKGLVASLCGKAPASGTGKKTVLVPYDDIDRTASVVTGNVASSVILKSGKIGYLFTSKPNATTGEATFAKGKYINLLDHAVTLRTFVKNQSAKDFMNELIAGARVVVFVDNNESGDAGETKYEVYGWDSGLTLSELPISTELADGVVYSAKLASDENSKEGQLPLSFFVTSPTATEAALASLYTPAQG